MAIDIWSSSSKMNMAIKIFKKNDQIVQKTGVRDEQHGNVLQKPGPWGLRGWKLEDFL